ncbi:NAD(P)-dependent oxidoreductase [Roseiarcaceae bacterium H3SJ34-1]|uniref:NAD-dependent epimerase/dehydratase family protein n=1 Tax=Terripilifer ovatus TaxID=3032367 RepID=UPI003AB98AE2|nr:NAD(P)-dependent oxidoreductase [Roseiarcaceae bacterium H3SJ34-1]
MKIFLAGASGAIGRPLVKMLRGAGHEVVGTTRSQESAKALRALDCEAVVVDVFDKAALVQTVTVAKPDVVMHQLTALAAGSNPESLQQNARLRREGTPNLVEAAIKAGVRRFIAQSIAWAYAPKTPPYREDDPLDLGATGARAVSVVQGVVPLENAVLHNDDIEGVVLRYGQLYGPGTWAERPTGSSPVHVEAAAFAALLAVDHGERGIYNITDPGSEAVSDKAVAELGWSSTFRLKV